MSKVDKKQVFLWSALERLFPITGEGTVIGPEEKIEISGIGIYNSKVDSGNDGYNVLHVDEFQIEDAEGRGVPFVYFKCNGKVHCKRLEGTIDVKKGKDIEKRPVVKLDVVFAGKEHKDVPFSLANRDGYDEAILIGKPFLHDIKAEIKF